jgi:cell division septal protein FtsQ
MDKRLRARRRTVGRERGRRRAGVVLIVVVLIACVALFLWLRSSDVFAVKQVVATATDHVPVEQIYEATEAARGVSLLALSTAAIEAELAALPYVRDVEVHRRFPATLEVELAEYAPEARVRAPSGDVWLVAEDGRVLENTKRTELPLIVSADTLTLVAGEYVPAAIADALLLARLMVSPGSALADMPAMHHISVSTGGNLTVVLAGGTELRLGDSQELEQKLTVAGAIVEQYLRDGKRLLYVDASVPDRVAVKAD